MARYDRSYDYGLRGYRETTGPSGRGGRIGDMQDYLHTYDTRAGSHTSRGGWWPQREPIGDAMRSGYDRELRGWRNF